MHHLSSFAFISIAKVSEMGVMASPAVFSLNSRAPAMIVVSSCVSSPPFPACAQLPSSHKVTNQQQYEVENPDSRVIFNRKELG